MMSKSLICGIDEAGRGPLAGPVVAAAVILPETAKLPDRLTDSKKLTERQRETLFDWIIHEAYVGVGIAEPVEIDRRNILQASLIAMVRAIEHLPVKPDEALIDGNKVPENMPCPAQAIVGGDGKVSAISAASIIAKVTRDRLMRVADERFPGFGLAGHKGYPSPDHKRQLSALGPSPIHRVSYTPVKLAMALRPCG